MPRRRLDCPDFVKDPDAINTDPREGLVPLFYWDTRGLNRWADEGDAQTITKKIKGGKNGLADRFDRLSRVSLVILGYRADNVRQFRADQCLDVDGDVGPKTRSAMHKAPVALTPGEAARPEVKVAPVTEEKPVPVTPPSLDAAWWKSKEVHVPAVSGGGAWILTALAGIPWQTLLIVRVALGGIAGFLYWRKDADRKAVAKQVDCRSNRISKSYRPKGNTSAF